MANKDDLRDTILHECDTAIHLHGKIPEGGLAYRPTPGQRTTLELLRYLAACGIGSARAMRDGNWDGYKAAMDRAASMEAEAFPALMAAQKEELSAFFDDLDDATLASREATLPWGVKVSLGRALLETTLKWLTAYRMQLFLYAKAAGNEDIGTANNWAGGDVKSDA